MTQSERSDIVAQRIDTELRQVADLLDAAQEIAHGLVALCEHIYWHDGRTKEALAAANHVAVALMDEHRKAEERTQ